MRQLVPFPIRPTPRDIIPRIVPGLNYLLVLENSAFSLEHTKTDRKVHLRKYRNYKGEEWSLEKFVHEQTEYYRIRNSFTGQYLAIDPYSGAVVGYRITMVSEFEAKRSKRASWKIIRNRNGSFSMVNVERNLSLTYSEKSKTKVTLQVFSYLPSQCFYLHDCRKCRRKLIGMMKGD